MIWLLLGVFVIVRGASRSAGRGYKSYDWKGWPK